MFRHGGTVRGDAGAEHCGGEKRQRQHGSRPGVGDERRQANETSGKGKGKGYEGKGEHGSKGGFGSKGAQQTTKMPRDDEEDEREQVATLPT